MVDSRFYSMVDLIVKGDAGFYVVMYRLWQFDDIRWMLWHHSEFYFFYFIVFYSCVSE
jgi:hypothetical protein